MKRIWQLILILSVTGCTTPNQRTESTPQQADSIPEKVSFVKQGKLVALLSNELTSYYVVKGQPRGFEYEMLRAFCKDMDIDLEIKVIPDFNHIIDSLVSGAGDIAAGNLTITGERMAVVDFSPPLLESRQVLIQRMPEGFKRMSHSQIEARVITNPLDLEGKKVHVHKNSSFYTRIRNYSQENALHIDIVPTSPETTMDQLIEMVSKGEIDYTIADENVAKMLRNFYPNLYI
ncbi:MAG: transporter substrate-binding domain-containing protein, partial [Bacteroidota bacterium]|nr:transporter substrate-binding domain-containing protein [Bacteroidota bacterium]